MNKKEIKMHDYLGFYIIHWDSVFCTKEHITNITKLCYTLTIFFNNKIFRLNIGCTLETQIVSSINGI